MSKNVADFVVDMKTSLLEGALWKYYGTVLSKNMISENGMNVARNMLHSYITEDAGKPIRMLNEFKHKTYALSEISRLVEEACKKTMESVDPENPDTFSVQPEVEKKFYDDLSDNDNFDDITNAIRMRVVDAEEKMSTDSIQDKLDSDEILRLAAQRVEAAKGKGASGEMDDDVAENIAQEAAREANAKVNDIATNRNRSVLEQLVRNTSKKAMGEGPLHEAYTKDNAIDYEKLVEACTAIYTFMEMCNTMCIEDFSAEDIQGIVL